MNNLHPLIVIGVAITIVTTVIGLAVKVGQLFTKYRLVEKVDRKTDTIIEKLADIGAKVNVIFRSADLSFSNSQSPIGLTAIGMKYYNELEIEKIINTHWEEWSEQIYHALSSVSSSATAYDVQKVCFDIFNKFASKISEEELNKIKDHAFKNGVDLILYDSLFQVPVRDRMLAELNLSVDDIDKHNTKKSK